MRPTRSDGGGTATLCGGRKVPEICADWQIGQNGADLAGACCCLSSAEIGAIAAALRQIEPKTQAGTPALASGRGGVWRSGSSAWNNSANAARRAIHRRCRPPAIAPGPCRRLCWRGCVRCASLIGRSYRMFRADQLTRWRRRQLPCREEFPKSDCRSSCSMPFLFFFKIARRGRRIAGQTGRDLRATD